MIAERPYSRTVSEARAHEAYLEAYPQGPPRAEPPANAGAVLVAIGVASIQLPYRGRMYELGHVSFEDGVRLLGARKAIDAGSEPEASAEELAAGNEFRGTFF